MRNPDLPWYFCDFPELPKNSVPLQRILEPLGDAAPEWFNPERLSYFWSLLEIDHEKRLRHLMDSGVSATFTAVRRLRRRRKREQIFNLRFDGLASCLRTPKGGSSTQYVVQAEHGKLRVRRLLGIEAARLQGVCLESSAHPFKLSGTEQDIRFAFGDAVCVPAVNWVVRNSIDTILHASDTRRTPTQLPLLEFNPKPSHASNATRLP
jgi:DNA (cytosine-5)-methyltransferase 1